MFGFSLVEILVVVVIGIIVFGPERFPTVARKVGMWIGKWRGTIDDVNEKIAEELQFKEVEKELSEAEWEFNEARQFVSGRTLKKHMEDIVQSDTAKAVDKLRNEDSGVPSWILDCYDCTRTIKLKPAQSGKEGKPYALEMANPVHHQCVSVSLRKPSKTQRVVPLKQGQMQVTACRAYPLKKSRGDNDGTT